MSKLEAPALLRPCGRRLLGCCNAVAAGHPRQVDTAIKVFCKIAMMAPAIGALVGLSANAPIAFLVGASVTLACLVLVSRLIKLRESLVQAAADATDHRLEQGLRSALRAELAIAGRRRRQLGLGRPARHKRKLVHRRKNTR